MLRHADRLMTKSSKPVCARHCIRRHGAEPSHLIVIVYADPAHIRAEPIRDQSRDQLSVDHSDYKLQSGRPGICTFDREAPQEQASTVFRKPYEYPRKTSRRL